MPDTMNIKDIAFPQLGIYLHNVPKSISIFGFSIAFYGIIIAIGVVIGFTLASKEGDRLGHPKDFWWDFSIPAIICSVLGARIYYVVFSWDTYRGNIKEIINIRNGGLAIYGAVIAGFTTLFVFCKIKKVKFIDASDAAVFGLLFGQILGRWGNFMNREAFGSYSDGILAMRLPIEAVRKSDISADIAAHIIDGTNYIQVHPTFLYESLLNLCLLIFMYLYRKHKKFTGEMALWYLGGYGIIRFFVEALRTDQLQIGSTGIAVSQMLGLLLFVCSVTVITAGHVKASAMKKISVQDKPDNENDNKIEEQSDK